MLSPQGHAAESLEYSVFCLCLMRVRVRVHVRVHVRVRVRGSPILSLETVRPREPLLREIHA